MLPNNLMNSLYLTFIKFIESLLVLTCLPFANSSWFLFQY